MISRCPQLHALFFFFFFFFLCFSRSGAVEQEKILANSEEKAKLQISSTFDAQGDAIPIVNPMTPSTTTPLVALVSPPPPTTLTSAPINQVTTPTAAGTGGAWCIAISSSSPTALQVALDYACGYGGTDCSALQPGASCYDPNTVQDHASYAFNDYYQKNPIPTSCVFGGTAQLVYADPSHGSCHFASSTSTTTTTPPATVTPSPVAVSPPPPVYYTPTTTVPGPPMVPGPPTVLGPPTIYGVAEPTGSPSSATSVRCSLLIVLITTCLIGTMVIGNAF